MGQLICEHRSRAGLSQRELADAAGVTLGMLRDLEQGRTLWPRWGSVHAVAIAPGRGRQPGGILHVGILGPLVATRSSRLRRLLGPARAAAGNGQLLKWTAQGYRLQAGHDCQVDYAAFRQLARDGHAAMALRQHARACDRYERASACGAAVRWTTSSSCMSTRWSSS
jgi:transcriptional regulator with XRE-family HTH domain